MVTGDVVERDLPTQASKPRGLHGGAIVRRAHAQRSVFEVLLPDADKLWDESLRQIDALLDDEPLVDLIVDALSRRHNRTRSLARRAFAISQRSRAATVRSAASVREQNKARMTALYREAIRITRAVVRDAEAVAATVSAASPRPVTCLRDHLSQTVGL